MEHTCQKVAKKGEKFGTLLLLYKYHRACKGDYLVSYCKYRPLKLIVLAANVLENTSIKCPLYARG